MTLIEKYDLRDEDLLVFFSGSKGFHVGLPTALWDPEPSKVFHKTAKAFAIARAEEAGVTVDTGVYDKVRAFRAPNSRHPKTRLHKRWFTIDELIRLSVDGIQKHSEVPYPVVLPKEVEPNDTAIKDWETVCRFLEQESVSIGGHPELPSLNRRTMDFIREGAPQGQRHLRLFSAAANLAEFQCSEDLAFALLEETARDTGLPPKEVKQTISDALSESQITK